MHRITLAIPAIHSFRYKCLYTGVRSLSNSIPKIIPKSNESEARNKSIAQKEPSSTALQQSATEEKEIIYPHEKNYKELIPPVNPYLVSSPFLKVTSSSFDTRNRGMKAPHYYSHILLKYAHMVPKQIYKSDRIILSTVDFLTPYPEVDMGEAKGEQLKTFSISKTIERGLIYSSVAVIVVCILLVIVTAGSLPGVLGAQDEEEEINLNEFLFHKAGLPPPPPAFNSNTSGNGTKEP